MNTNHEENTSHEENTNWCQSVVGIVLKGKEVLLVRHTYGAGKGKLIIPGGYVKMKETPQDALRRELLEETTVVAEPILLYKLKTYDEDHYHTYRALVSHL